MRKTHNRAVLTARASRRADRPTPARSVGTNPGARTSTTVFATGPVRRSSAMKLTATQKNSDTGRQSEWCRPMDYFTDPLWGQTVTNQSDSGRNRQGVKR